MPAQLGLLLMDRGVQIQGYLVSRPIKAATVPVFIEQARRHLEQLHAHGAAARSDLDSSATRLRTLRPADVPSARPTRLHAAEEVRSRRRRNRASSAEFLYKSA